MTASALFVIWCWRLVQLVAPTVVLRAAVVTLSAAAFLYVTSRHIRSGLANGALIAESDGDGQQ